MLDDSPKPPFLLPKTPKRAGCQSPEMAPMDCEAVSPPQVQIPTKKPRRIDNRNRLPAQSGAHLRGQSSFGAPGFTQFEPTQHMYALPPTWHAWRALNIARRQAGARSKRRGSQAAIWSPAKVDGIGLDPWFSFGRHNPRTPITLLKLVKG